MGAVLSLFYRSTPRQILKYVDIKLYLEYQRDYAQLLNRVGELARARDPSTAEIGRCLCDLHASPMFEETPAFKRLWALAVAVEPASPDEKKRLLRELYLE